MSPLVELEAIMYGNICATSSVLAYKLGDDKAMHAGPGKDKDDSFAGSCGAQDVQKANPTAP